MYPLEAAAEAARVEKMELLVKYGADIKRCTTGLKEIAAMKNNLAIMDLIEGKTGTSAVQSNSLAVMTEPEILNDFSKITPDLINQLRTKGVDMNAHSPKGGTALINVIQNSGIKNKIELIKALINNGVNVNQPNKENPDDMKAGMWCFYPTSPLKAAIEQYNLEIVKLLVENGANVNQSDGGESPLKTAKNDAIKEYLILKGAK